MKFCPECGSIMVKSTSTAGNIVFQCRCQLTIPGHSDDTLMAEIYIETNNSSQVHNTFIENSPFDPAANIVLKDCPNCKLNFLSMIQIGSGLITMYTCSCGFQATRDEYIKLTGIKLPNKTAK